MGCSPSSHFKHHPLISFAVLLLIFSLLLPLSPTLFTLLVFVLSSVVLFISLRKKKGLEEHPNRPTAEEIIIPPKTPQEKEETADHHHQEATHAGSPDLLSDCEGVDVPSSTSNDDCSDADWSSFQYKIRSQIPPPSCSDGSISDDDDSLIEIALPGRQYVVGSANGREELIWSSSPQADFLFHNHQDGRVTTAEINDDEDDVNMEEDNLIEIDISAGSIKWPRPGMEIQA
ncbi:hypothetical protein ACLOJK_038132 [Asimina triloba]